MARTIQEILDRKTERTGNAFVKTKKIKKMTNDPIVMERLFDAPVSKVWNAITDKNEMKHWYFDLEEFRPEVGFRFSFTGGPSPEKQYVHLCEVTEVVPGKKLVYSWKYEGYQGISHVSWELSEKDNKTLLRLTHTGIGSFPEDNPDFDISNFRQGWTEIINKNLKDYLEKAVA